MRPPIFNHAGFHLELDSRVLLFTAAISLARAWFSAWLPPCGRRKTDLATDLKERAGAPAASIGMWRLRAVLVMAQVAFSLVALIGAGLFVRSLRNAGQIDPGFDAAHLGIVAYNVTDQAYNEGRGREYHQRALERAASVHGVISAALARDVPFHVVSSQDGAAAGPGERGHRAGALHVDQRGIARVLPNDGDPAAARAGFHDGRYQDDAARGDYQ